MPNFYAAKLPKLLLAVLLLPLAGCPGSLPQQRPPSQLTPSQLTPPPLPLAARQPPKPSQCSLICSASAASDAESSQATLMQLRAQGKPASSPMTR